MSEERRNHPRMVLELPAEVETATADSVSVNLQNISMGGVLIEGDQQLAQLKPPVAGVPLEMHLHFGFEGEPCHCHCRLVYLKQSDNEGYRCGLMILSADQQAMQLFEKRLGHS